MVEVKKGPSVTLDLLESRIVDEKFLVEGTLTMCVLELVNGFRVVGTSGCADPANFDEALGREIARKKAVDQLYPLEGYALATRLQIARDREAEDRIEGLAAEIADHEAISGAKLVALYEDDVENAKRQIREVAAGTLAFNEIAERLTKALQLLTPEVPPLVAIASMPAEDATAES